ncbi:MAG TPA: glutamate--tRNA ligase [Phycisphaerae bacterium]|nr:glutamate--tRNA ligase [Phycisphaerae bacterium]
MLGPVKTRFAPSPTGHLHVGNARTALFSWLYARHVGGTFLLRIEDTDRSRHVEDAVEKIADDLRWLGIDWDEGHGAGGDAGPYRQSERLAIYREHVDRLIRAGQAYYAFESAEELEATRKAVEDAGGGFRYQRPAEPVTDPAAADRARAAGKSVVVRFLNPGRDVTIRDHVFGEVTIAAAEQDDFILLKADRYPTYHAANVIDDGLMGVTLVMRGQEFLAQTWRQTLLRAAWGFPEPDYAHLPLILDMQGRKLSKRDGDVEVHAFRAAGYLPEAIINFIALLGWNPGGDREKMSREELIEAFSLDRLSKTNARFDRQKLLAFNTAAVAAAAPGRLLAAFKDYLSLNQTPIPSGDDDLLAAVLAACKGFRTFSDIIDKAGVLFGPDDAFEYDPAAVTKFLAKGEGSGYAVLAELRPLLAGAEWTGEALEALIERFCREKDLGMGKVAQPIRVAVAGRAVSPGIADTLVLLGKDKTLARIDRCLAMR